MAEMGLGYGSEFHLMRFLGHHRNDLNRLIHEATNASGTVEWKDYPYDHRRISGDGELTGIECFKSLDNYAEVLKQWRGYWPQSGSSMNWDGIFQIDDTWYFVEAKANIEEKARDAESHRQLDLKQQDYNTKIADIISEIYKAYCSVQGPQALNNQQIVTSLIQLLTNNK